MLVGSRAPERNQVRRLSLSTGMGTYFLLVAYSERQRGAADGGYVATRHGTTDDGSRVSGQVGYSRCSAVCHCFSCITRRTLHSHAARRTPHAAQATCSLRTWQCQQGSIHWDGGTGTGTVTGAGTPQHNDIASPSSQSFTKSCPSVVLQPHRAAPPCTAALP